jgi:hypothetical protein
MSNETVKIENAIIESTMLGYEGHGILTCYIGIKAGHFGGSFGGYSLDEYHEKSRTRIATPYGLEFITRIMRVIGVETWEELKGKHCRIRAAGLGCRIGEIGHIIEDKWFDPAALLKEYYAK